MYCFLQIQPFAAQLLDNTQGAQGIPSVRVRPGRSGLEQNLSELVIHTTTVLQTINHVTICEPLRLLMDNPAALKVQLCFRFAFLVVVVFFCSWKTVPTDCQNAKYELQVKWTKYRCANRRFKAKLKIKNVTNAGLARVRNRWPGTLRCPMDNFHDDDIWLHFVFGFLILCKYRLVLENKSSNLHNKIACVAGVWKGREREF